MSDVPNPDGVQAVPTDPRLEPIEPDAEVPSPLPTQDELKVLREVETPGIVGDLEANTRDLWPQVEDHVRASLRAKGDDGNLELDVLRLAHLPLKKIWQNYDQKAAKVVDSGKYSPQGKEEELAVLQGERDKALQEERERLQGLADAMVKRAPSPGPPPLTSDVAARGQLLGAMLENYLPEDVLELVHAEIALVLEGGERAGRAKATLHHVLRPILRRRSCMPEYYAVPFQGAYRNTLELVERLLDTSAHKRLAVERRDQFRKEWEWMNSVARGKGWDDLVFSTGAQFFDWSE
jgi:hypothetical protein